MMESSSINPAAEIHAITATSTPVRYHSNDSLEHILVTTLDGNMVNDGIMFDIRASPTVSVEIKSLTFLTDQKRPCDLEVYTKEGSHLYFEETNSAWTRIVNDSIECQGPDVETLIDERLFMDMEDLKIEKGAKRAFYIRVNGVDIVYSESTALNEVYVEDSHIQILEGTGLSKFFQEFMAPRIWNGRVAYKAEPHQSHSGVCSRDIGSNSAGSTSSNFGLVFDIKSKAFDTALTLKGLAIHTDTSEDVEFAIYTIPNGFENGKGSMQSWMSPVAEGRGRSDDSGQMIITNIESVYILPGKTIGIYVTLKTDNLLYHTTQLSVSSTFVQNDDMIITVGSGVGSYPQKNTYYPSRGLFGQIFYLSDASCDLDTTVSYFFVIHYPKDMSSSDLNNELEFRIKTTIPEMLKEDDTLKTLKQSHALEYKSTLSYVENESSEPCSTTKKDFRCIKLTTNVTLSHEDGIKEGLVEFGLLQNVEKVMENMNFGSLDVYYSGDEPLDTLMIITISGVPRKRMEEKEIKFFERSTLKYLKNNVQMDDAKILFVEVKKQSIVDSFEDNSTLAEKGMTRDNGRLLEDHTGFIDITTAVTGKHRPPSPGLNFDDLVEDSINSNDSTFKEELVEDIAESGIEYFSNVKEIRAMSAFTSAPTASPIKDLGYAKIHVNEKGLGVIATLVIIISAATFTFILVFGALIFRRRRQEKKKFKLTDFDVEDEDDEEPLFFDTFKNKKSKKSLLHDRSKTEMVEHARKDEESSETERRLSRFTDPETSGECAHPSRHRISTREVSVDINGENYNNDDVPENNNRSSYFGKLKKKTSSRRSSHELSSRSNSSSKKSGSQYNLRSSASSHSQNMSALRLSDETPNDVFSRIESHQIERSIRSSSKSFSTSHSGYSSPGSRRISTLSDHQSRRSIFDCPVDDNSSVMSSSTSSTLSSANIARAKSSRKL